MLEIVRSLVDGGHTITLYCIGVDHQMAMHPAVTWVRPVRKPLGPQLLTDIRLFVRSTMTLRDARHDLICVLGPCALPKGPFLFFAAFSQTGWQESWSNGARPDLYRRIYSYLNGLLERIVVKRARGVVAMSPTTAKELRPMQSPGSASWSSPGGVDQDQYQVPEDSNIVDLRKKWGIAPDAYVVGFVGEFRTARKGLVPLAIALDGVEKIEILVRGSGDSSQIMQELEERGCRTCIRFAGEGPAQEVYHAADVVAIPSLYEPFSLVAVEAAASGLPVVISAVAGAASFIEGAGAGLVVDPLDLPSIRNAITTLMEDPDRAANMGASGRKLASEMSWSAVSRTAVDAIENTAGGMS